ncbi:hypothetical protein AYI68_g1612 [Smittium mucronatum]|uniref:Uncharacterized protein n=1 Tax=Smittium mucronatum TaxID=133383 RepID=A0A1R0H4X7_9FUNG|nr:hypothetical protein AYI68_g1612 [Smittium mucronatum]
MTSISVYSEYQKFFSDLSSKNIHSGYGLGYLNYAFNSMNPFIVNSAICIIFIVFTWVMSLIPVGKSKKRNYSYVDRLWSIAPPSFAAIYIAYMNNSLHGNLLESRTFYVSLIIIIWGIRLTYNFYRRGGYSLDSEDYRWEYVKAFVNHPILWELLNLFFISIAQMLLLMSITFPVHLLYVTDKAFASPLTTLDYIVFIYLLLIIAIEALSDQQQWNYQTAKYLYLKKKNSSSSTRPKKIDFKYEVGFIHSGLFRLSRHPNFFCEQLLWLSIGIYCISVASGFFPSVSYDYIIGSLSLITLFLASTDMTEKITASKYPKYAEYQKKTSKVIPWFSQKISYKSD